jgi:ankyrin repeat protein
MREERSQNNRIWRSEVQAVYEKCLKEQKTSTERLSFMKAVKSGNISIVILLLQNGADIAERNDTGQTSLHIATLNGSLEMMQVLLNGGIDIEAKDNNNMTALYYAARAGNEAILQILRTTWCWC